QGGDRGDRAVGGARLRGAGAGAGDPAVPRGDARRGAHAPGRRRRARVPRPGRGGAAGTAGRGARGPPRGRPPRRGGRRPRGGREAAAGDLPARRGASAARRQERRVGLHTTSALPLLRRRGRSPRRRALISPSRSAANTRRWAGVIVSRLSRTRLSWSSSALT